MSDEDKAREEARRRAEEEAARFAKEQAKRDAEFKNQPKNDWDERIVRKKRPD
jgi:hypothetical protein